MRDFTFAKLIYFIWLVLPVIYFSACSGENAAAQQESGLVQEGMSKDDVMKVLGRPLKSDSSGIIYNVGTDSRQKVERWYYEKRTVVFINDTLKSTNTR